MSLRADFGSTPTTARYNGRQTATPMTKRERIEYCNRQLVHPKPWSGPTNRPIEVRHCDNQGNIEGALNAAAAHDCTLERRLYALHAAQLFAEASRDNRDWLRRRSSLVGLLGFLILEGADESASGARLREHALNTVTLLYGEDPTFDEWVAHDDHFNGQVVVECLRSTRHMGVVVAATRYLRRWSEEEGLAHLIVFSDVLVADLLALLAACAVEEVLVNVVCVLVNVTACDKTHFMLARCQRLLELLVEEVSRGVSAVCPAPPPPADARVGDLYQSHTVHPPSSFCFADLPERQQLQLNRCELSLRALSNLLSHEENNAEIKRLVPSLGHTVLACTESPVAASVPEIEQACRCVLARLRGTDNPELDHLLSIGLMKGQATAQRVRSAVLDQPEDGSGAVAELSDAETSKITNMLFSAISVRALLDEEKANGGPDAQGRHIREGGVPWSVKEAQAAERDLLDSFASSPDRVSLRHMLRTVNPEFTQAKNFSPARFQ